ncbi:hypothetical protein M378DRAFT_123787 [Amanita muscaria Koide BX008]|uniref:DUF3533 domain-containing protein n=1 Tax=Amanita muscaria (strain Koide BX008) TaxID=946122 RepID=A0A0C2WXU0_AMAMK|nr:hypothetical protein M378DRAFT_123787 [Amanita muscaria Koide BX008]
MTSLDDGNCTLTKSSDLDDGAKMELTKAWKRFLKTVTFGAVMIVLTIFAVLSIYWGALWKIPDGKLSGWIVDFDGGMIGVSVTSVITTWQGSSSIAWTVVPAEQFAGGSVDLAHSILKQHTWIAISVNEGATSRLIDALNSPNATYDGSEAITLFAAEGRNEFAYRSLLIPSAQSILGVVSKQVALNVTRAVGERNLNITTLSTTSPQTLVQPVSFRLNNLAPFDIPVASAVTYVGLLYQTILAFFLVMVSSTARTASGIKRLLSLRHLIILRLVVPFVAYFIFSLCYSLMSLGFQINFERKFGTTGFVVFWMANWLGMLASGLALEAMITLLTHRFVTYFLLLYLIANVSVCTYPLEVLPSIFRYGYASPFYNVSQAVRTVLFRTKNEVGQNMGVLIVWIFVSCITLSLFQWLAWRRRQRRDEQKMLRDSHSRAESTLPISLIQTTATDQPF